MDLARYLVLVDAVVLEKRSYRDVAAAHGVSKSWVATLVARFREGGYEASAPRSKARSAVRATVGCYSRRGTRSGIRFSMGGKLQREHRLANQVGAMKMCRLQECRHRGVWTTT